MQQKLFVSIFCLKCNPTIQRRKRVSKNVYTTLLRLAKMFYTQWLKLRRRFPGKLNVSYSYAYNPNKKKRQQRTVNSV